MVDKEFSSYEKELIKNEYKYRKKEFFLGFILGALLASGLWLLFIIR